MSTYKSQGFGQQPFIIQQSELQKKGNQIIDQREYNQNGFIQTSEGQEINQIKRSAPPQPFAKQDTFQPSSSAYQQGVANISQSQTPFQFQSQFQSAILNKTLAQNQPAQNNPAPLSNQMIYQSQQVGLKSQSMSQYQNPAQQNNQIGNSQYKVIQQRDLNSQYRPQSASNQGIGQQARFESSIPQERQSNLIGQNLINPNQSIVQNANEGLYSQRNNIQFSSNNLQVENLTARVPAAPSEIKKNQIISQQEYIENNNPKSNNDYHKQGSKFPPSQSYYNSSLLQEIKPIEFNQFNAEEQQSVLHQYAQFFFACGYQLDSQIGDEQTLQILNMPSNQFDLEVLQQIKDEANIQDSYTVRQFLEVYIKAISVLYNRMDQQQKMIKLAKDKLNELIQLQEQARINEQTNPNQQSTLYIEIQKAKGLDRQSQYITRIQFDINQFTETKRSTFSSDPVFDEEFKLKINNPNSILTFSLVDAATEKIVGYVTQKLKQFFHQKKIDEWYILEDQGGALGDISKQISIAIQWVHSERLYYENILRENDYFEPIIKDQEEKLSDTFELLKILRQPFEERDIEAFKLELQDLQQEKKKKSKKRSKPEVPGEQNNEENDNCWTSCMAIFDSEEEPKKVSLKEVKIQDHGMVGFENQQQHLGVEQKEQSDYDQFIDFKNKLVYIYIVISAAVCFFKPNFIDVCISLVLQSDFFKLIPQNCNRLSILLLLSLFFDILWMVLFTSSWFSYMPSGGFNMVLYLILEITKTVVKVIITLVLQKIRLEQTQNQSNQQQPNPFPMKYNNNNQNNINHYNQNQNYNYNYAAVV
ncbi:hypothetical protein ABPG72_005522 [Tetrahymena utriculariae]